MIPAHAAVELSAVARAVRRTCLGTLLDRGAARAKLCQDLDALILGYSQRHHLELPMTR
jgi:hypothetical protein